MKRILKTMKPYALVALPLAAVVICAWQNPRQNQQDSQKIFTQQKDTVPGDRHDDQFNMKELDKAMKELGENMNNLDLQLKDLDVNIDKQINESLAKVDFDKIGKDIEASLKAVDWNNIQKEVDNSIQLAHDQIRKIDFDKINEEMKDLQKEFDSKEFKEQFNSEKLHKEIDDAIRKANEGIEKAKENLQQMKEFTNELEQDGLINRDKPNTIEWKNGNLIINGKEQPKSVADKYRKYYKKDGKITFGNNDKESESF